MLIGTRALIRENAVYTVIRNWLIAFLHGFHSSLQERIIDSFLACEQALLFGRAKRVSRKRASERRSREGQRKGELATISHEISFVLRSDERKYHWLKNDVRENKVD